MNDILNIINLNTYLKTTVISQNINLRLEKKEVLGMIGESGCGKTITALSLTGLIPIEAKSSCDQFIFDKETIDLNNRKQLKKIRAKKISYIFQEPSSYLNPVLTIGEQIFETIFYNSIQDRKIAKIKSFDLLKSVGLKDADYYKFFAHQLSAGMNQRAMIALAIASNPKVLIADEATSALDPTIKQSIIELIKKLIEKFNLSVIWITHDVSLLKNFATRVVVMYAGRIIEEATVMTLYKKPAHPYTQALIGCLPEYQKSKTVSFLKGEPPDLNHLPNGCKFNTRCPYAFAACFQKEPDFITVNPQQKAKCYLLSKI